MTGRDQINTDLEKLKQRFAELQQQQGQLSLQLHDAKENLEAAEKGHHQLRTEFERTTRLVYQVQGAIQALNSALEYLSKSGGAEGSSKTDQETQASQDEPATSTAVN